MSIDPTAGLDSALASITARLYAVESRPDVSDLRASVSELTKTVQGWSARVDGLEKRVAALETPTVVTPPPVVIPPPVVAPTPSPSPDLMFFSDFANRGIGAFLADGGDYNPNLGNTTSVDSTGKKVAVEWGTDIYPITGPDGRTLIRFSAERGLHTDNSIPRCGISTGSKITANGSSNVYWSCLTFVVPPGSLTASAGSWLAVDTLTGFGPPWNGPSPGSFGVGYVTGGGYRIQMGGDPSILGPIPYTPGTVVDVVARCVLDYHPALTKPLGAGGSLMVWMRVGGKAGTWRYYPVRASRKYAGQTATMTLPAVTTPTPQPYPSLMAGCNDGHVTKPGSAGLYRSLGAYGDRSVVDMGDLWVGRRTPDSIRPGLDAMGFPGDGTACPVWQPGQPV